MADIENIVKTKDFEIEDATLPQSANLKKIAFPPRGIVIHTTGRGVLKQEKKAGLEAGVLAWYKRSGMRFYGRFIIFPSGRTFRLAPDDVTCMHSGSIDKAKALDPVEHAWWIKAWPKLKHPYDQFKTVHFNSHTIGLDLVPLPDAKFTDAQFESLKQVVRLIREQNKAELPIRTHSDIDPWNRTSGGKGWDPGASRDWYSL